MAVFLHIRNEERAKNRRVMKPRIFRDRLHPLDAYDDEEIRKRYRLTRQLILTLHDMIQHEIEPQTNRNMAVPAILQIFIALRYYACGSFQVVVGDSIGVHRSTVSRIITRVTASICGLKHRYVTFPRTRQAIQQTKEDFYDIASMPNVIGAIIGTLIMITRPKENENLYVSRKGGHT